MFLHRYKQRLEAKLASKRSHRNILRTPSARRSRQSVRSGYAFAHQEGFGRLITSGKIMRPNPILVHPHHGGAGGRRHHSPHNPLRHGAQPLYTDRWVGVLICWYWLIFY